MKQACMFVCLFVVVGLGAQESPDINPFIRGDVNLDARVGISDVVQLVEVLFGAGRLDCPDAADSNDDGRVDISDAAVILSGGWLYSSPLEGAWCLATARRPSRLFNCIQNSYTAKSLRHHQAPPAGSLPCSSRSSRLVSLLSFFSSSQDALISSGWWNRGPVA